MGTLLTILITAAIAGWFCYCIYRTASCCFFSFAVFSEMTAISVAAKNALRRISPA